MTLAEAHERAMANYCRARVREGDLPELAAEEAVKTWSEAGVLPSRDRDDLIARLAVAGAAVNKSEEED